MKKHVGFLFFMLASVFHFEVIAQPILTKSILPVLNDSILMAMDTQFVDPGNSGASMVWDFSKLKAPMISTRRYVKPNTTPYATTFQQSVLCKTDGLNSVYSYWSFSDTAAFYHGFVEPSIYDQAFTPPIPYYRFPMHYNDAYTYGFMALTNPGSLQGAGVYTFKADGYGQLKLPNKTATNVLRTQSVLYIGDSSIKSYSLTKEFAWYSANVREPIMVTGLVILNGSVFKKYVFYDNNYYRSGISKPIEKSSVSAYPNPFENTIKIESEKPFHRYEMYDLQGKCVLEFAHQPTSKTQINTSDLPNGVYTVFVIGEDFTQHIRVIK